MTGPGLTDDRAHGFSINELATELAAAETLAPSPAAARALRRFAGQLAGTIDQQRDEPSWVSEPLRLIERG
jgi:hypothetical protein